MTKKLLLWSFLLINILMFSACGSTSTTNTEDLETSKRQKEPKSMYGMIMESSKTSTQRKNLGLHAVQHTRVSQKSKTNGATNNVKGQHKGKNSATTNSIKSSSLFIPLMLLVGCIF